MTEFNRTVDDIKRARLDFSNNWFKLDCIRPESYDIAIECMTECCEQEFQDLGEWEKVDPTRKKSNKWCCSCCGGICYGSQWWEYNQYKYCPNCGKEMLT